LLIVGEEGGEGTTVDDERSERGELVFEASSSSSVSVSVSLSSLILCSSGSLASVPEAEAEWD
jgi:hypothetical protein